MRAELNTYELQERERLFRTIFDSSPDAIFIEDLEGNVLDANPAACRLHGLSHEELVGMNVSALVPPEYRSSVVHADQLIDGEIEGFSLGTSGRRIPVSIRTSAISYMGRTALLLQVRDITERRQTEQALRDSEARYRLLFDTNPQPMWVHDVETRRFIAVNEAAKRLYRLSSDEFLRMESIDSLLAQPMPPSVEPDLPKLPNLVEVTTTKHRRKDGAVLTLELTQHTMMLDGRLAAFVMISKVISAR
jgi:two-component system cell cycle sensor histidine kinase/response regulator CckA